MGTREEYDSIKQKFKDESLCPFCPQSKEENEILFTGKHWTIIGNKYPYNGIREHLLVFPRRHIEFTTEIEEEEWKEMKEVENWMRKYYEGKSYFSFIRQMGKNKSIKHLHYHYLPGEVMSDDIENMLKQQNL